MVDEPSAHALATALMRELERVGRMHAELQAARLLTWRAASMMNRGRPNSLEASMAKAKAGLAVTQITQKAVSPFPSLASMASKSIVPPGSGR